VLVVKKVGPLGEGAAAAEPAAEAAGQDAAPVLAEHRAGLPARRQVPLQVQVQMQAAVLARYGPTQLQASLAAPQQASRSCRRRAAMAAAAASARQTQKLRRAVGL
jgi:hypothetical protein